MKSLNEIIDLIELNGLTAYEISKEVPLTEAGILKMLKGESKPRESTLAILSEYLDRKYPTSKTVGEPMYKYNLEAANESSRAISIDYSRAEVVNHIADNWREYIEIPAFQKMVKAWAKKLNYEPEMLKEIAEIKKKLGELSEK